MHNIWIVNTPIGELEIDSDIIFHEILNNQEKVFDVLEIFVK